MKPEKPLAYLSQLLPKLGPTNPTSYSPMATKVSPSAADNSNNLHYIPLLKEEDARYAANTGISSANFYQGDITSTYNELKSRLKELLRSNPWIGGVVKPLSKVPKQTRRQILNDPAFTDKRIGKSILVFPKTIADQDIDNLVDSILTIEDEIDPQLKISSTYAELAKACQNDSRVVPNRSGRL